MSERKRTPKTDSDVEAIAEQHEAQIAAVVRRTKPPSIKLTLELLRDRKAWAWDGKGGAGRRFETWLNEIEKFFERVNKALGLRFGVRFTMMLNPCDGINHVQLEAARNSRDSTTAFNDASTRLCDLLDERMNVPFLVMYFLVHTMRQADDKKYVTVDFST